MDLIKLENPTGCCLFIAWMRLCSQPAYWQVGDLTLCDEHVEAMADEYPKADLRVALKEIQERREKSRM